MNQATTGVALAIAIGLSSGSAMAGTSIANVSNKGSLLVYQLIEAAAQEPDGEMVDAAIVDADTLITLTNDSSTPVKVKCYYASSDRLPTPYTGTAVDARPLKHYTDFTIDLTHNQPISWWASTGRAVGNSAKVSGQVAPPFGLFASDGTHRVAGELKCWAVNDSFTAERHWNHLFGTATVIVNNQALEYTATAFQAQGPSTLTGNDLGSPGLLNLDNVEYDACPNILLGNFIPGGRAPLPDQEASQRINSGPRNVVILASCNQDLRQAYTPTITKLTWTFWNQDEAQRTGTHTCADSWFETNFPANGPSPMINAQYFMLGTEAAYFRIETTADTQICGPSAQTSGYTGIITQFGGLGHLRATNLTGRGVYTGGVIKWDPAPEDSFKK